MNRSICCWFVQGMNVLWSVTSVQYLPDEKGQRPDAPLTQASSVTQIGLPSSSGPVLKTRDDDDYSRGFYKSRQRHLRYPSSRR